MRAMLHSLARDEQAVTVAEFALIAPALILTIMGLFDLTYNLYADTMIEGAVQNAARDASIEKFANNPAALDTAVREAVKGVVPSATVTFTRSAYTDYSDVGQAEDFTDTNHDGICNNNESFEDVNGNGVWDADRALAATSGARDAVVYDVTAAYDRMFPVPGVVNLDPQVTVTARTILRNQPFNLQQVNEATLGSCPA
ncbi:TadE/TadG family type IV pilus assembly protein [Aurantiacibacter odishensis]|uniref:TadE/TadG family type IV pilus assembly protein n=1 Tax=Aurantiacibacter odishensis TaxID=1155476 RepID=UPI0013C41A35|nr:TadE/TadG family type IV pilus assembly protein [Aurantiacibacter odishensis]